MKEYILKWIEENKLVSFDQVKLQNGENASFDNGVVPVDELTDFINSLDFIK